MKLSYLDLSTTDPSYNLAAEQYVFDALPRDRAYFMLWQNDRAIIVGKHQNTLAEINEPYVRAHDIRVVRRLSGGGAVYHDLGNLNFTFITDDSGGGKLDFRLFCQPIVRTLATLGVTAEVNGRNDITLNGRKFSGNSQYIKNGRVMHHGTILFDSDLSVVAEALRVDREKLESRGIRSVSSRVTNLRPFLPEYITLPMFRRTLLEYVLSETPGEPYELSMHDCAEIEALRAQRYATWEWNYGKSPACTLLKRQRIEGCGTVEIHLAVKDGVIEDAEFRGDFFSAVEPEALTPRLLGLRPEPDAYREALRDVDVSCYFQGMTNEAFMSLLCE